jgi:hypothetical protein
MSFFLGSTLLIWLELALWYVWCSGPMWVIKVSPHHQYSIHPLIICPFIHLFIKGFSEYIFFKFLGVK